jgi:NAD dependent epimerase/dehydratase
MNNFWNEHNVFITGADGFIGSHLTEKLVALNANVTALSYYNSRGNNGWLDEPYKIKKPDNLTIIQGDIRDANLIDGIVDGATTVFHLSSLIAIPYSYTAYQSYIDTNITGLSNLLTSCRRYGVEKIVHTSTSEVYGSALYTPINEQHPLQGQSPYAGSKIAADVIADSFYRSFDLPITTARPFNTYGPRQSLRAVIPAIIQQLINKKNGSFLDIGDLSPRRDFNFVSDTVDGFLSLGEANNVLGKVYNIGSGVDISIEDLCSMLFDISGKKLEYKTDSKRLRPEKSEVNRLLCDPSFLKKTTGWESKVDLNTGLKITYDWFKSNGDQYGKDTFLL